MRGVAHIAAHDISEYNRIINNVRRVNSDQWFVTSNYLFTKEQYKLNRLLGLHNINKQGYFNNTNGKNSLP